MARVLRGLGLIAPLLALIFFRLRPEANSLVEVPLFHFYIVTFTTFSAVVLSILLGLALEGGAQPRHLLAAVAFATMGVLFFTHGLATPQAIIHQGHPALPWSAWLTLLAGGLIFAIASQERPDHIPAWLSVRRIVLGTVALTALYLSIALFAPSWLLFLNAEAGPWHRLAIFTLSLAAWLVALWRFGHTWQQSRRAADGALAFVALWLAYATLSLHQFPVWSLAWWLYHFLLLLSFLVASYILVVEYEQARQFRLLHYYIAASLILTALLALIASDLFARFSYRSATAQVERGSTETLTTLVRGVSAALPADASPDDIRDAVRQQVATLELGRIYLYDDAGNTLYPRDPLYPATIAGEYRPSYEAALAGTPQSEIHEEAAEEGGDYGGRESGPLLYSYVPIPAQVAGAPPVGVVLLLRTLPELVEASLTSRRAGLAITGLTMTLLFTALLLVVRRANAIIATRTDELHRAKRQSDELLLNILPANVAEELKQTGRVQPVNHELATVMFTDFQNFTRIAATLTPEVLVSELDECFSGFDAIIRAHQLEKLKTVGDGYMCAGGIPTGNASRASDVVRAALAIQAFMEQRKVQKRAAKQPYWDIRIGIHSGPLVAGVIGREKFAYDVWGDTVNTAHRLEEACDPGKVNISGPTYALVQDEFACHYRGKIAVKNKSPLDMYYVVGTTAEPG